MAFRFNVDALQIRLTEHCGETKSSEDEFLTSNRAAVIVPVLVKLAMARIDNASAPGSYTQTGAQQKAETIRVAKEADKEMDRLKALCDQSVIQ